MEQINDLVNLLGEGTVRGVILTLVSTVLLVLGKKTWTWLRSPCSLSPVVNTVVNYLLHEERLHDSSLEEDIKGAKIVSPTIDSDPYYQSLDVDGVGDIWKILSRHEKKAVKKAHNKCVKALRNRDQYAQEIAQENEERRLRKEAEKALCPFVKRENRIS